MKRNLLAAATLLAASPAGGLLLMPVEDLGFGSIAGGTFLSLSALLALAFACVLICRN